MRTRAREGRGSDIQTDQSAPIWAGTWISFMQFLSRNDPKKPFWWTQAEETWAGRLGLGPGLCPLCLRDLLVGRTRMDVVCEWEGVTDTQEDSLHMLVLGTVEG